MRHLPNLISLARLLLAPVVAWMIVTTHAWAWWTFFWGAWSDALDGLLARSLRVSSPLGTYLDPLADKAFVMAATVAWAIQGRLPLWLLLLILGRDAMILAGSVAIFAKTHRRDFAPTPWGKLSTILQLFALAGCFLWDEPLRAFLFVLSAAATLVSAWDYIRKGWQMWNGPLLPRV